MEPEHPEKVQEGRCHGDGDGEVGGSIHDSAQGIEQVPQDQAILAQQVKRAHPLVILVHEGEEEEWGYVCELVGNSSWGRLGGTLEEYVTCFIQN